MNRKRRDQIARSSGAGGGSSVVDQPYQFRPETYGALANGVQALVNTTASSAVINTTPLAAPAAPTLSNAGSTGALTAGTYQVEITYVNQWGETVASASASQAITGTQPLTISFPAFSGNATGWNAYVTQAGGSTYIQQGGALPIGQNLVLTTNPVTVGAGPPASNTTAARVFTSTPVDGGKNIMINGALGTPGGPWVDTIASVQSPTQATLSTAGATATVTGAAMVFSSDDRAAIDACLAAAQSYALANQLFAQVLFNPKIYGLGSGLYQSLGNNNTAGLGYNTQVRIPVGNSSGYTPYFEIQFIGASDSTNCNFWMSAFAGLNGTCLVSYAPAGPNPGDATFGQQSVIGGPNTGNSNFAGGSNGFFNTQVVIRNLQVVQRGYTNAIGIDLQWIGGAIIRGSSQAFAPRFSTNPAAVNPSIGWITDTFWLNSTIGTGLRLPNRQNDANIIVESFTHVGMNIGISTQADWPIIQRLDSENFKHAVLLTSGPDTQTHELVILHWAFQNAGTGGSGLNAFNVASGAHIKVDVTMDGENIGIGADVSDPQNVLFGQVLWSDPFRTAVNGIKSPTVTGGANLNVINGQLGPGHMATPPPVPASTVAAQLMYRNAAIKITTGVGVTVSAITVDGTATGQTMAASSTLYPVRVPTGKTIALTYAGGTPTWDWWLD